VTESKVAAQALYQQALAAMGRRDALAAIALLEQLLQLDGEQALFWRLYGFALRDEQRMREALEAFRHAESIDPEDPLTLTALAQTQVQCGLPAVASVNHALARSPDDPSLHLTRASALIAEGQPDEAVSHLEARLRQFPGWLEGQHRLAEVRWTTGDPRHFARGYEEAVALEPGNLRLRLAWFRFVAQARDWEAARRIIQDAQGTFGDQSIFAVARTYIAAESGASLEAERLFEQTRGIQDEIWSLAWIRHCLRERRPAEAEREALRLVRTASANLAWPYLSLIWRLTGDARADWLDGAPPYVRELEVDLTPSELNELAQLLRRLHTARAPYIEQSVRGGTQTERPLFFRVEPIIERTKAKITEAVREYIAQLPAYEAGHPLLGTPRERVLFAGSWSVRLTRQGYNVPHTHPMGWLSSAFYVSLPSPTEMGAPPAGWLRFGEAPAELGLELAPYAQIEPRVGRLALFPSTMWHATVPFDEGERLALAFDVRTPSS